LCHPGGEKPSSFSAAWEAEAASFIYTGNTIFGRVTLFNNGQKALPPGMERREEEMIVLKGIKKQFLFFHRISAL
jgi:hypothetical protein